METPGITPTPPTPPTPAYGVGRLKHDRDRQNKHSFEEAFAEEEGKSVAEDDTAENDAKTPPSGDLQEGRGFIRKDEEDGLLHVDIVV